MVYLLLALSKKDFHQDLKNDTFLMAKQRLYFIAIIPPPIIAEAVTQFKRHAAEHFESAHALKSPSHITLIPPFRFDQDQLKKIQLLLPLWTQAIDTFSIQLKNFASFPPRVIYVDVIKNPALENLHAQLKSCFENTFEFQPDRRNDYHPHMTVAFKDLSKVMFYQAWDYFSKLAYKTAFEVRHVSLLKHSAGKWEVIREIALKDPK